MLKRILLPNGATGRKLCFAALLALAGVTALAYDSSVSVEARWRVLPYQSLTMIGSGDDPSLVSVLLPAPTDSDRDRGYVESENALRLHIASNVPWKVQLRFADSAGAADLQARQGGGEYAALSTQPLVLAAGSYGVYDLDLDLRRPLHGGEVGVGSTSVQLIATIMPE